ncbi:LysR family transcriptional regulator [Roseateles sp. DB2]|uniref:LysR family transcriptional regulator n=1 Tax=Roseateles sp. DB2 TaxID=3453717 RepID=UPI003EEC4456
MDRLTALQVFVETAERGSLTAAAAALDMSRAMASRHLEAAERWLGARLLQRSTRRLSLTEAGQEALARCRQLVDLAEEAREVAGQHVLQVRGRLRITASTSFAQHHLAGAVADFMQAHPQAQIELLAQEHTLNLVEDRIDLALRISNELDPTLVARRLSWCRSVLCAAPAYLARQGEPGAVEDLALHDGLLHSRFGRDAWRLSRTASDESVQSAEALPRVRLRANETAVLLQAALAGAGIAQLPTYLAGQALREGRLRRVLADWEPQCLGIHAVYTSRRYQPLILRSFLDFLAGRFDPERPYWDAAPAAAGSV